MRMTGIMVAMVIALGLVGAAYAQEMMKGEVATVHEASGKISIKLNAIKRVTKFRLSRKTSAAS
jgi:ABC-type arginine transport system permease subunit